MQVFIFTEFDCSSVDIVVPIFSLQELSPSTRRPKIWNPHTMNRTKMRKSHTSWQIYTHNERDTGLHNASVAKLWGIFQSPLLPWSQISCNKTTESFQNHLVNVILTFRKPPGFDSHTTWQRDVTMYIRNEFVDQRSRPSWFKKSPCTPFRKSHLVETKTQCAETGDGSKCWIIAS